MSLCISREKKSRCKKFHIFTYGNVSIAGTSHITFVPIARVALVITAKQKRAGIEGRVFSIFANIAYTRNNTDRYYLVMD